MENKITENSIVTISKQETKLADVPSAFAESVQLTVLQVMSRKRWEVGHYPVSAKIVTEGGVSDICIVENAGYATAAVSASILTIIKLGETEPEALNTEHTNDRQTAEA